MKIIIRVFSIFSIPLIFACGNNDDQLLFEARKNFFSLEGSFSQVAGNRTETWSVSGEHALIDWTGTETVSGEFSLEIFDAEGTKVYSQRSAGTPPQISRTSRGRAGDWQIGIEYTRLSGNIMISGRSIID